MAGQIEYPSPEVLKLTGHTHAMGISIVWWPATEHDPEHYTLGWSAMTRDQVRKFARQLLNITARPGVCGECGEPVRPVRGDDRIDPRDYKLVHEDGNPICDYTPIATEKAPS